MLLLAALAVLCLSSCRALFPVKDVGGTDGTDDTPPAVEPPPDIPEPTLTLIDGDKAYYRFVSTAQAGATTIRNIDKTISHLRACGIEVEDRCGDMRADDVAEYEIIVGIGVRFRDSACSVERTEIGNRGYVIKAVGNRIIIAGGTAEKTNEAFQIFRERYLGIDSDGNVPMTVTVPASLYDFKPTEYKVSSVSIAGNDLAQYQVFVDRGSLAQRYSISLGSFFDELFDKTGYLITEGDEAKLADASHAIVLRYTENAGEGGFRMYVEGNHLIFESEYANALEDGFIEYMRENVMNIGLDVNIPADARVEKNVREVHYSDFGAVGDGVTDDYEAIYAAHEYANRGGQTVYADSGTYYVNAFTAVIPIKTNVVFGDAKFIIDDRGDAVFATKHLGLFNVQRNIGYFTVGATELEELAKTNDISVNKSTTSLPWLAPYLTVDSLVRIYDYNHYDYVRYGANENHGTMRQDVILVHADGTIDPDTPPAYNFETVTSLHVFRTDDEPITISGGEFETICCRTVAATDFINKWAGYYRGFTVARCNVTISGIKHTVTGEPEASPYNNGGNPRSESYPYYGFIFITECYNVRVEDAFLTGRKRYYEDKGATLSGGDAQPVPMGSYDYVIEHSSHTVFDNVQQLNSITDQAYWGIMSSNGSKNMTFRDCSISRYDAHRSFFNGNLINTTIGHTFNVIGGGTLYCENTVRVAGNSFISLRSDYGATFNGDMILKDCTLQAYKAHTGGTLPTSRYTSAYIVNSGFSTAKLYLKWDFGYTCYMPRTVTLDNFKSPAKVYVFTDIKDAAFNTDYPNAYVITDEIIYRNMSPLTTCSSTSCKKLRAIKVTEE